MPLLNCHAHADTPTKATAKLSIITSIGYQYTHHPCIIVTGGKEANKSHVHVRYMTRIQSAASTRVQISL
ncbi:predicted protein [Plenodomus lingam JN3]|uniref:Predicted protein n=1 Tax=Leptosphaeria maculans (strain JN3 / isolate v23.1.3 / race Av1-4-5-6-7-8) TaxID=985895 RepID=E4ZMK3_LEPMJ|nr:predicted protein [Plenodomus lingam JN3]CBX92872.1 predicted protein [Plenodomus lingam JN3]